MSGCDEKRALRVASAASAISVTRQGASPSIPTVDEVKTLADEDDGVAYMPFNSENIKSADPVTCDDNENVIPLSERFSTESDDIRHSPF